MAFSVVRKGQSGSGASALVATEGATATAGNVLIAAAGQINSLASISFSDDKGSSGWTTITLQHCEYGANVNSGWVGIKVAAGGEKEVKATAGAGGTVEGVTYIEVAGLTVPELDVAVGNNNIASTKTAKLTEPGGLLNTNEVEDIVFAVIFAPAAATGTISAWTGSPTAPTNVGTTSSRIIGGYFVAASKLTNAQMTANWETSKAVGMLVVAIKSGAVAATGQVMVI